MLLAGSRTFTDLIETMSGRNVLITGATSGLGRELAAEFMRNGYKVVVTGRRQVDFKGFDDRFEFFRIDFTDLKAASDSFKDILSRFSFEIVLNNAGILSPAHQTITADGIELTLQVNYLAHLLLDDLIIRKKDKHQPLTICTVTSPVYRLSDAGKISIVNPLSYSASKAYADSKFLSAFLCRLLHSRYRDDNLTCISFNPGIFASGIYRTQGRFFRMLYRVAAPVMRSPSRLAEVLFELLTGNPEDGVIYNRRKKKCLLPVLNETEEERLGRESIEKIIPYLQ